MHPELVPAPRSRQALLIAVIGGTLLVGGLVGGCRFTWEEGICEPDKVVVVAPQGGGWCEDAGPTDLRCPDGQIARRLQGTPGQECVTNVVGHEHDGLRVTCERPVGRERCIFPDPTKPPS
jgi:hypothetical protein